MRSWKSGWSSSSAGAACRPSCSMSRSKRGRETPSSSAALDRLLRVRARVRATFNDKNRSSRKGGIRRGQSRQRQGDARAPEPRPIPRGNLLEAGRLPRPARLKERHRDVRELRGDEAGQLGSRVAADPEVRTNLLKFQQDFASQAGGAVLDGRDIGTVICPDAPVKLFVTASLEARADRRFRELRERGVETIRPRVLAEMAERDRRDSERAAAPLKAAPDAWLLDTSDMDADAAFAAALAFIERKGFRAAGP